MRKAERDTRPSTWRGSAFGVQVESDFRIPCLQRGAGDAPGRTSLELVPVGKLARARSVPGGVPLLTRRFPDGRPMMTIHYDESAGYRIWAPRHGCHLVSNDGRRVRSALPKVPAWRWQRLLFAQVLPLAAKLQGLELFHASAVAIDGRAVAFVAPSGTGKTSVAAHLAASGMPLVTDDVLALESTSDAVRAHPGAAMASLDPDEWRRMTDEGRKRLGEPMGRSDKIYLEVPLAHRSLPLRAVYYLGREARARTLRVEAIDPPAPDLLLASAFIAYVRSSNHLLNHLNVCARVAQSARIFRVVIPPAAGAVDVASAVEAHATETALRETSSMRARPVVRI
jgi:hypothetical protein